MAAPKKIEAVKELTTQDGKSALEATKAEAPAKVKKQAVPVIGTMVHYIKNVATSGPTKLKTFAAVISGLAENGNFQPQDQAVDLTIFITQGGVVDMKNAVLYSETPVHGRWTHIPKE